MRRDRRYGLEPVAGTVLQAGGAGPGDRGQAAGAADRLSGRLRKVSDGPPDLHMLNLVVTDMAASLDFYRRLGIAVPEGPDAAGAHVQLRMPGGFSLELDTAESARLWHAAWRSDPAA